MGHTNNPTNHTTDLNMYRYRSLPLIALATAQRQIASNNAAAQRQIVPNNLRIPKHEEATPTFDLQKSKMKNNDASPKNDDASLKCIMMDSKYDYDGGYLSVEKDSLNDCLDTCYYDDVCAFAAFNSFSGECQLISDNPRLVPGGGIWETYRCPNLALMKAHEINDMLHDDMMRESESWESFERKKKREILSEKAQSVRAERELRNFMMKAREDMHTALQQ